MTNETLAVARRLIQGGGFSTVSFALFRTFLLRRCVGTEGVFERTVALAPLPERLKQMPETFVQYRTLAQNTLRIDRGQNADVSKVTMVSGLAIEAIYNGFAVHALNLPRSIRPALVEAELKAELELCFVNPDVRELYAEARRLGLRVGIVAESYWSEDQIRTILAAVAADLPVDFIYSSASPDSMAVGGLFPYYLKAEGVSPFSAVHIGVDEDTVEQSTAGITLVPYEPFPDPLDGRQTREVVAAKLLAVTDRGFHWRLDNGFRLLRRVALTEVAPARPHHVVAAAVLGPMMVGFQRHIERRLAEIRGAGRAVKVLFLARDGFLPMRIWSASGAGRADYVEINRRIAMVAGSQGKGGLEIIQQLIAAMPFVNAEGVEQFFKIPMPQAVHDFFADADDGLMPGDAFSDALPDLIGRDLLKEVSDSLRRSLMGYLQAKLDDFTQCTDMVLVDIGYTGNIQKGLRRVFDMEGLPIRLHGIYLMPHGESFVELPGEDTVSGYFDDTVMTPGVKRGLMRDAPLIEEFCCAPVGSARGYDGGQEIREADVRLPAEISFCLEMQDECVRFFDAFHRAIRRFGIDPLKDFETYRAWTAAILCRFVMMPDGMECQTFGPLMHDVSLGSKGLIATITTADITNLMGALPFPAVCSIHHPPVWLGGSLAAHNAVAGFAYAATGFGLGTDDFFRDVEIGDTQATLVKDDRAIPVPVSLFLSPFGDIRLRIPCLRKDSGCMAALPLVGMLSRGIVRSVILQGGANITEAMTTRFGSRQGVEGLQALNAVLDGSYFRASAADALLILPVPAFDDSISVLTVLVTPIFDR
jgi:hypothetical protein